MANIRTDVRIYSGIFFLILAALGVIIFFRAKSPPPKITNFDQCAKAGFPIMDSYPRQCTLLNGITFVEQVLPER